MNALISLVVLALYPFFAVRRYFEYKYTKPGEAQDLLRVAIAGIIGFTMAYITFKSYVGMLAVAFGVIAFCAYFSGMLVFIRINYKLRGETPV